MRRTRDSLAIHHQPWDVLNYFEYIKKLLKGCPRRLTSPSIPHHPTDRPDRPGPLVDDNDALCWTWLLMNVGVLNYIIKFQHNRKGQTTERKSRGVRGGGEEAAGGKSVIATGHSLSASPYLTLGNLHIRGLKFRYCEFNEFPKKFSAFKLNSTGSSYTCYGQTL